MIQADNKVVHGLWIGGNLSPLEMLTVKSFLYHGHEFHLWVYDSIGLTGFENLLGLVAEDANQIIPASGVFAKKDGDPACGGIGKGSYGSPFSDMFRYKLLHERGGWWTDMDVTCLKPLDFSEPYFFRNHPMLQVVGTVMKCPPGSKVMRSAYERTKSLCSSETGDWLLPNKILNEEIVKEGLMNFRHTGISNSDIWKETARLIKHNNTVPGSYYFLHWMNEEWRVRGINKNVVFPYSTLGELMKKFDVLFVRGNWFARFKTNIRSL